MLLLRMFSIDGTRKRMARLISAESYHMSICGFTGTADTITSETHIPATTRYGITHCRLLIIHEKMKGVHICFIEPKRKSQRSSTTEV